MKPILYVLVALIGAGASGYLTYPGAQAALTGVRAQEAALRTEVSQAESRLAGRAELEENLARADAAYTEWRQAYPPEEDLSALTALVFAGVREQGLEMTTLRREVAASGMPGITEVRLNMGLVGDFSRFYDLLAWVPRQRRQLSVGEWSSSVGSDGEHTVTLTGYILNEAAIQSAERQAAEEAALAAQQSSGMFGMPGTGAPPPPPPTTGAPITVTPLGEE